MDTTVKCRVNVSHLTLGNREGHEEVKTYRAGDMLRIPKKLARKLGNSVTISEDIEIEIKKAGEGEGKKKEKKQYKDE